LLIHEFPLRKNRHGWALRHSKSKKKRESGLPACGNQGCNFKFSYKPQNNTPKLGQVCQNAHQHEMKNLSQGARLVILALYGLLLIAVCKYLFGTWLPPTPEKGLWFYAAVAHLLLGTLLLSPYFTKPVDAVSDAVIAALILLEISGPVHDLHDPTAVYFLGGLFAYYAAIVVFGATAMATRQARSARGRQLARAFYLLSTEMGETPLVFSLLFFFAVFTFHVEDLLEFATLTAMWIVIVPLRLFENIAALAKEIYEIWSHTTVYSTLAEPYARKEPNLLLLRRTGETTALAFGEVISMRHTAAEPVVHGMVLDEFQLAEERWIRCMGLTGQLPATLQQQLERATARSSVLTLSGLADQPTIDAAFQQCRVYPRRADLIGFVAPNTDIATLRFEITNTMIEIGEGQLVDVMIGTKSVLYQVLNGFTQEEILAQKNTYGYARGSAKKIGTWNGGQQRFEHTRWIPQLNEPVFLQKARTAPDIAAAIGFFPNTQYPVTIDVNELVTHNTAILGILGVGKTFLALELVERMLLARIKVIALDLTNQYAAQLTPYYDSAAEQANMNTLRATGPPGKLNMRMNVAEGGSVEAFRTELRLQLTAFMADANALMRIYNPTSFEIWRQDAKLFSGQAAMVQLTPTEITSIITEVALDLCSGQITEQARLCIVFEEAHSLIPEWNAVAYDGDKAATNRTAKAILQGRKYGLGCLVITQRTANVTKTILNQCNTLFGLRVYDATGMEFLSNYIGNDYSSVLSTLENRHAVVFGRASSCSDPVLVRLNDRDKFLQLNRPNQPQP
jgi:hypothetical protein